jgi:hypothetical protein
VKTLVKEKKEKGKCCDIFGIDKFEKCIYVVV